MIHLIGIQSSMTIVDPGYPASQELCHLPRLILFLKVFNGKQLPIQGGAEDPDAGEDEDAEEEEGPDFLLRESARIVADMAELGADVDLLKRQFAQLSAEAKDGPGER